MEKEIDIIELQPHELRLGLVEIIKQTQKSIGYQQVKKVANTHLDKVVEETVRVNKELTFIEIQNLAAKLYSQIMHRSTIQGLSLLSKYYAEASNMSPVQLRSEVHSSSRLARHLKSTGLKRPLGVSAHAIVSGKKNYANGARRILAKWRIRVDDPDNGVFLPRDSRYIPHKDLPNAVNHAKIHTKEYYINITSMLRAAKSEDDCRLTLRLIADDLVNGTLRY